MMTQILRPRFLSGPYVRALLVAALAMTTALLGSRDALASAAMAAAAESANGALSGCASNSGKALYDCVANVLDNLANTIPDRDVGQTQGALRTAAAKLRVAVNKVQALSAITQCRALISGALAKVRAIGGGHVQGWGGGNGNGVGLEAVVSVLNHAAKLIQTKG